MSNLKKKHTDIEKLRKNDKNIIIINIISISTISSKNMNIAHRNEMKHTMKRNKSVTPSKKVF